MTAKNLLDLLKSGPPAPRVALLPDHRFFLRLVPVTDAATPADVTAQVELALETLSPFPPAQLYHGFYWTPGAPQALVFAAYRKRFTPEQTAEWAQAELVIPAFAAFLGLAHEPATTLLFPSADGLTAIHWDSGTVPTMVLTRTLTAEATDTDRAQARDELLRSAGGSRSVIELTAPPEVVASPDERVFLFRAGESTFRLPMGVTGALDVRDKAELATLRGARSRDLVLWWVLAGCVGALVAFGLGELALVGGRAFWLKTQSVRVSAQAPMVEKVMTANDLANRIEELSNKRLLPLEMVEAIAGKEKRGGILFTRIVATTTNGIYSIRIEAQTQNPAELDLYLTTLSKLPTVASATNTAQSSRNGMTTFTLVVTFKPDAIKPAA
jgi:hypothetical protein